jgi:hypothetical protein
MIFETELISASASNNCGRLIRVTRVQFDVFLLFQLVISGVIYRIFGARKCGDVRFFINVHLLCARLAACSLSTIVFSDLCTTFNKCRIFFSCEHHTASHLFLREYIKKSDFVMEQDVQYLDTGHHANTAFGDLRV